LNQSEQVFVEFLAMTGLRPGEAVMAFNLIIKLGADGRLTEYYNQKMQCLEHYKHRELFLRRTKNCYISFVSEALMSKIMMATPIKYNRLQCCLKRRDVPLQLKQLRSHHNSYLRKSGVMSELVDILAGRVPKSVFVRHYLGADMDEFSRQVLSIQEGLMMVLFRLSEV